MDERHLKYLYAALAVLFGLPSLVGGGAAAMMLLLMGLGQFGHGSLASVTLMPLWGLSGIAGCLAWLWLSAGYLMQGRAGLRVRPVWWRMLLAGGLAALPPLGLALWWGITVHAEGLNLLLLGPSMLVPAAMLRLHKRLYIAQCLLLGLPALVAGGGVAGFGIYTFLIRHGLMRGDEGAVLFLWASAGVAGLLAWLWLSIRYLRRGRDGLRHTARIPWIGLALGAMAALAVIGVVLFSLFAGSPWQVLGYLVLGVPLLLPSAHLVWLRRAHRSARSQG
uniref:Uncharacterized protein n=1 Tax=Knufia peltigerae TaxID=1002370 RepID=A0AA39CXL5_9EURO|nr:hypothetical protein H2204_007769 [Knufia peltigerae]